MRLRRDYLPGTSAWANRRGRRRCTRAHRPRSIDRDRPVSGGIFRRSRKLVYLGLVLLTVGVLLVLGRLVLLALDPPRGRFLAGRCGGVYREYARSVGRWWTWRTAP
jgi:protein-S-isoprenylcysteine O-methyltransferase Ste14